MSVHQRMVTHAKICILVTFVQLAADEGSVHILVPSARDVVDDLAVQLNLDAARFDGRGEHHAVKLAEHPGSREHAVLLHAVLLETLDLVHFHGRLRGGVALGEDAPSNLLVALHDREHGAGHHGAHANESCQRVDLVALVVVDAVDAREELAGKERPIAQPNVRELLEGDLREVVQI